MSVQSRWRVTGDSHAGSTVSLHRHKHPTKVHISAGISRRGRIGVCEGIMKEELFVSILDGTLLLFIDEVYLEGPEFMVDSDPKHNSGYAAGWTRENSANWWNTMSPRRDFEEMWYFPTMVTIGSSVHFGLDLPSTVYFIHILFLWYNHMLHERYMNNFTININIPEMLTQAHAIGTRPLFALPGYKALPYRNTCPLLTSRSDTHTYALQSSKNYYLCTRV